MKRNIKKENLKNLFAYQKPIAYYETDSLMVVHHSNYIRYMEETRVDWIRKNGLLDLHAPVGEFSLAVLETRCVHLAPLRFGDTVDVRLQARVERAKVHFEYAMFKGQDLVALGMSVHVPLDSQMKIIKIPSPLKALLEKEIWTETWL